MTSFIPERFVDVTFILGKGTFAGQIPNFNPTEAAAGSQAATRGLGGFTTFGPDRVTLRNHRVACRVSKAGAVGKQPTTVDIWGMSLSLMNRLSTLGWRVQTELPRDTIVVEARTDDGVASLVYMGTVSQCIADFNASPDVHMHVEAYAGLFEAIAPAKALSFKGAAPVSKIIGSIQNLPPLENNLTRDVYLTDKNLPGTAWDQLHDAADAAGIRACIDNGATVLCDRFGHRADDPVPLSPSTGMVGYPKYYSAGLQVRTLYNPALKFWSRVQISDSIVKQANGVWTVIAIDHHLDSLLPGGEWFSDLTLWDFDPLNPFTPPDAVDGSISSSPLN